MDSSSTCVSQEYGRSEENLAEDEVLWDSKSLFTSNNAGNESGIISSSTLHNNNCHQEIGEPSKSQVKRSKNININSTEKKEDFSTLHREVLLLEKEKILLEKEKLILEKEKLALEKEKLLLEIKTL